MKTVNDILILTPNDLIESSEDKHISNLTYSDFKGALSSKTNTREAFLNAEYVFFKSRLGIHVLKNRNVLYMNGKKIW